MAVPCRRGGDSKHSKNRLSKYVITAQITSLLVQMRAVVKTGVTYRAKWGRPGDTDTQACTLLDNSSPEGIISQCSQKAARGDTLYSQDQPLISFIPSYRFFKQNIKTIIPRREL